MLLLSIHSAVLKSPLCFGWWDRDSGSGQILRSLSIFGAVWSPILVHTCACLFQSPSALEQARLVSSSVLNCMLQSYSLAFLPKAAWRVVNLRNKRDGS